MGTVEAGLDYSSSDTQHHKELDAEALFVLKSRGSWLHCGYHLTTSIVAPALLSLPFAFALLGWVAGVSCLIIAVLVTFYSYNLLSKVLEHHAQLGQRQLRFRDMASDILGPRWGRYFVGPLQFSLCYAAVIACTLLGGQSLKFIYLLCNSSGTMKLYEFVAIFGVLMLILAQIPSFHSLRHINLISLTLCLAYSTCATIDSTYIGNSVNAPPKDSSVNGDGKDQLFGAFNAISIIATTYGNGIIPEIQATIAPPVEGKMFKGLCLCYAVVILTFFTVAISGYWAFGNKAKGTILGNFMVNGNPLVPKWLILITSIFTLLQVSAVFTCSQRTSWWRKNMEILRAINSPFAKLCQGCFYDHFWWL
ncbi:PREDICTED: GABA transporter 1-like isoform X4 [Nelumbo nucifera]|uniref:GABA transporter 1-like isoform X4 n=1 Tax=Nelumbo nucifera TaxID=4432 RepID=A0A1U8AXV0_NELNU|nr:PREDICTED: GABA transporter 1-like isoform X4 [Nelumbo nucifera]